MRRVHFSLEQLWRKQNELWLSDRVCLLVSGFDLPDPAITGLIGIHAAIRFHPAPPANSMIILDYHPTTSKPIPAILESLPDDSVNCYAEDVIRCKMVVEVPAVLPWLPTTQTYRLPHRLS